MSENEKIPFVLVHEKPHRKHVILADVNVPYKFSLDRRNNYLFFCINAEEFSDQSFQTVVLDLNSSAVKIVPNIRNGFASAVDQNTGTVYLGGSEGIYKYNYQSHLVDRPAVVSGVDVFDIFFKDYLYFVETSNLDLYVLKNNKKSIVSTIEAYGIHHCAVDGDDNLIFTNPSGLFALYKNAKAPVRFCDNIPNIRGVTTNTEGRTYLIAENGVYSVDQDNKQLSKVLALNNGYGLAFDNDNNIIYSEERSVVKLIPC